MNQESISRLLSQAASAHHRFEQTVLDSGGDHEWQAWYAGYVIEHGLNELLPQPISVDRLSQFLTESNRRYEQIDKREAWAQFTADDLIRYLASPG